MRCLLPLVVALGLSAAQDCAAMPPGVAVVVLPLQARCDTAGAAVVAAMTTAPTSYRKQLVCTLTSRIEGCGAWANLDAFYVMAAASSQAARINWRAPGTFSLTASNGPTFTVDRGYAGDGVSASVTTGFVPSTAGGKLTANSISLFAWSRTVGRVAAQMVGTTGNSALWLMPRNTDDKFYGRLDATTDTTSANTDGSGFYLGNRTGASAQAFYQNGAQVSTSAFAAGSLPASQLVFLQHNATFSTAQVASGGFGGQLSTDQISCLNSGLATYLTNVGAR